jgi:hypothetical protein
LRVAFLAEVVLAMFSKYPSGDRSPKWSGFSAPDVQPHDRRSRVVRCSLRNARPWEANMLARRRRSKNSGGIAPAAIGALIEGTFCSVNGFRTAPNRQARA